MKANRQPSLTSLADAELVLLRARVRAEIRKRGIADSVGAVGEQVAIQHFAVTPTLPKLQLAPRGTKNVDALSRSGERYSIKTICEGAKTGTVYPEPGDENKQLFEYLVIVKLAPDWGLVSIHQFRWEDFLKVRCWDKRMNAWYVPFSERALRAATLVFAANARTII